MVYSSSSSNDNVNSSVGSVISLERPQLSIPSLLDYTMNGDTKKFELIAQEGEYEFVAGVKSDTYGFNGDILGPTIRVSEDDKININVTNNLKEQTTTHWHGGVVPGDADGGVHNIIKPGDEWDADFDVIQQAATLWYHPHQHEETARQVYMGLGGFIIVDDDNSTALNIPQNYGIDDIPIIIQSKSLSTSGKLINYQIRHHDLIHGFEGNTLLVNAQIHPELNVTTNLIRLRILNGSNSDLYTVTLSNGESFEVIASDGGFYNSPITVKSLFIPTAKRNEILIDVSGYQGKTISVEINGEPQLDLNVAEVLNNIYEVPEILNTVIPAEESETIDRNFDLELLSSGGSMMGMMGTYAINGQLFDMERIDFVVQNDRVEYWKISNIGTTGPGLFHPFHVHATQFQIIEFNGKEPGELLQGRHDTIYLAANDSAIIAVPFDKSLEGIYMYHCHILEHEDAGMMGQFELKDSI